MMRIYIEGIGLCGPGLHGWVESLAVLAGTQDYIPGTARVPPSMLLPANERRRAVQTVKIALAVGADAFAAAKRDPAGTAAVFTSSGGDGETLDAILNVLASPNPELSPTRFHNSVHNAPAGYWSIATGSRAASTSICCHDDSFAAGLLEAVTQAVAGQQAVALIAYDVQYPAPLNAVRRIGAAFGVALVLSPAPTVSAIADVGVNLQLRSAVSVMAMPDLEALRQSTPAARSLPLLAAVARGKETEITLDYLDDMALILHVAPAKFAEAY